MNELSLAQPQSRIVRQAEVDRARDASRLGGMTVPRGPTRKRRELRVFARVRRKASCPSSKVLSRCKRTALVAIALPISNDEVVESAVRIPGPRHEVIDFGPSPIGVASVAVETSPLLDLPHAGADFRRLHAVCAKEKRLEL